MQRTTDIANINDINVLHVLNNIFFFFSFFIFKVISTLFQGPYFIEWNFSIRNQMRKITNGSVDFSRITIKTHDVSIRLGHGPWIHSKKRSTLRSAAAKSFESTVLRVSDREHYGVISPNGQILVVHGSQSRLVEAWTISHP